MNSSRFVNIILQRNTLHRCFSSTKQKSNRCLPLAAVVTAGSFAYCCLSQLADERNDSHKTNDLNVLLPLLSRDVTHCREEAVGVGKEYPSGYSESKRFYQVLAYHRELLADYQRRWPEAHEGKNPCAVKRDWPRRIPKSHQVGSLEFDLQFCERSQKEDTKKCQDLKFRIACFYIYHGSNPIFQKRGLNLVKDLATKGHPDGMCLYGTFHPIGQAENRSFLLTLAFPFFIRTHSQRRRCRWT